MRWVILNLETLLEPARTADEEAWSQRRADPEALEAAARLARAGHHLVLISTERDCEGKRLDSVSLCALHARINEALTPLGGRIEASLFCPHGSDEDCECRTPRPGLLHSLGERLQLSMQSTPVVSSRIEDMDAAREAGATGILIRDESTPPPTGVQSSRSLSQWVGSYLGGPAK